MFPTGWKFSKPCFCHQEQYSHYSCVTKASWRLKSQATWTFIQHLIQPSNKEITNCPHYWPFVIQYIVYIYIYVFVHYGDVIMSAMWSQITRLNIVYSTVYSGADQRKHQSSASLAFVRGIHRWPLNSPHKGPGTRKMVPFDDVIMEDIHLLFIREFHLSSWWHRTLSALLTFCKGSLSISDRIYPRKGHVMRSLDVLFVVSLNKQTVELLVAWNCFTGPAFWMVKALIVPQKFMLEIFITDQIQPPTFISLNLNEQKLIT